MKRWSDITRGNRRYDCRHIIDSNNAKTVRGYLRMNSKTKKALKNIFDYDLPAFVMIFMAFANAGFSLFFGMVVYASNFNKLILIMFLLSIVNIMYFTIFYISILKLSEK